MKNVTLSAEEHLIEQAREIARTQRTTLNAAFRDWLRQYTAQPTAGQRYDEVMKQLSYVRAGRKYTRDEMNER